MKASLALVVLALAPTAVLAQPSSPAGSLTIISRPPGVACRVSGDRIVVGRTPLTLESGLSGRLRVRAIEPGMERWERKVELDGVTQDTLWMTLTAKSALKASARSLVVPGWGQFYSERPAAGWVYLTTGLVVAGGALVTHLVYLHRVDQIPDTGSVEDRRWHTNRAEDAYQVRQALSAAAAGIWAVNLLDAMVFFPNFRERQVQVGLDASGGGGSARVALEIRF